MELPKYTNEQKRLTIKCWKQRGVIYHNFDELYEVYIKTMNCQHCGKEFPNTKYRHLDHNHETGMFRKIVCHKCNAGDSYINHPEGYDRKTTWKSKNMDKVRQNDKERYIRDNEKRLHESNEYYKKNREQINIKRREKIMCDCGVNFSRSTKSRHEKSMKHLDWFMNYVD
tara:strand:- start:143 stop:652 length:510 start_codon:yes stop_codon:yes gene_type:complete